MLARLDIIYSLDGRMAIERSFYSGPDSSGNYTINFPSFWSGPIWLQPICNSPSDEGEMVLTWWPWRRRQNVQSAAVYTTRKAAVGPFPLEVRLPAGWSLAAGVGVVPTAIDINDDWFPANLKAGVDLFQATTYKVFRSHLPHRKTPRLDTQQVRALPPQADLDATRQKLRELAR